MTCVEESSVLKGVNLLIVDDDRDSCELLSVVLQIYGAVDVRAFSCVNEALTAFQQLQPQVLISDIAMPEVDGFSLIQTIRAFPAEQGGKIPVLALSAMASNEDRQRALQLGFDCYLTKPLDAEELISTLLDLLQEAR